MFFSFCAVINVTVRAVSAILFFLFFYVHSLSCPVKSSVFSASRTLYCAYSGSKEVIKLKSAHRPSQGNIVG